MKKILLALLSSLFLFASASARQVTIEVDGELTEKAKAELQVIAAEKVANPAQSTAQSVKEWVDIGSAVGVGLASTAKELGVAANDFANTPVGKFTVFLIAWNYMGQDFLRIAFGFVWLTTLIPTWIWLYRRASFDTAVSYFEKGEGPGGARKIIEKTRNAIGEGTGTMLVVSSIVIVLVGVLPIIV